MFAQLREQDAIAQALTLTVTYADRPHPALAVSARELLAVLGLQRARVRTISLRAERLQPAEHAVHQLTFNARDDKARDLEAALDCYGPGFAGAAPAYSSAS